MLNFSGDDKEFKKQRKRIQGTQRQQTPKFKIFPEEQRNSLRIQSIKETT